MTINYLKQKNNDDKWTIGRKPGTRQKRKMIAMVVSVGVKIVMSNHTYTVGDNYYLQTNGGPIGLELTGAVSRPYMQKWNRLYLERVKGAGLRMPLYERYVDNSNQVAEVPAIGCRYDRNTRRIVQDDVIVVEETGENEADARLALVLRDIADDVKVDGCWKMDADCPSWNTDSKMAILDMKVWMGPDIRILYQHYDKDVTSKQIINTGSA